MGVAVGDYDNDGWPDVFITTVGNNHLFHNDQGLFRDVTATAGVRVQRRDWSTSAAFVDYDNDGDLDLFVANYVRWSPEIDFEIDFRLTGIGRAYGPPTTFEGSYPTCTATMATAGSPTSPQPPASRWTIRPPGGPWARPWHRGDGYRRGRLDGYPGGQRHRAELPVP